MTSFIGNDRLSLVLVLVAVLIAGCATSGNEDRGLPATNPPPSEPFKNFGQFRLEPVTLSPTVQRQAYGESARADIDRSLQQSLGVLLASWDKGSGRTLVVQPMVEDVLFVGGGGQFYMGAPAGSPAMVMRVVYRDQATGAEIATPVFYQHASAMSGTTGFGTVLGRSADLITLYARDNYETAVGGPTGAPPGVAKGN
ncbi:MAG: hypothetical protein U1E66_06930 [Rhodospirillales bacterium]